MARRADGGDGVDDELAFHLARGTELLAQGDADRARAALERALDLGPKDAKVLALLGQACYRQGQFDDAAIAWQRLVDENPVEPAARVNLGLAFLKAKHHEEARRQLEIALDLNPDHRKAMGYLGLALLESGDPAGAREWFRKAGSDHMVARCDELVASGWTVPPPPAPPEAPTPAAGEPPAPEPYVTPVPGSVPVLRVVPPPAPEAEPSAAAVPTLAAWGDARLVPAAPAAPFTVRDGLLTVTVRGTVRVRLDGLFAVRGEVTLGGELMRFRGRATERPFGEGATRMHRASGEGALLYAASGRRFTALELDGEAVYLREEAVFGFEDGLAFENGRVPSTSGAELSLVHLRGRGGMLLVTAGAPLALEASTSAAVRLPLAALVGWTGALTPRLVGLAEDGAGTAVVELSGEGRVLADPDAAVGGSAP
ncbi:Tetratricopeptide TPR_2 repeat protein [Anaeromyxobacter dehalogenans 2CP-1]|uniref:Tetratricopeptide TPR_2 repeat protein n=1 Tax=Anaeromyxobacter dehalogenans (strain ATCC BAA-258 / DSM 21875 / 2CP-1) TaxID=455488 RepID=B8J6Q8_ANAD2|nr:tetratricopeptide repeat protein [Anaeromyxobacter dehalogenans]ACL67030.1 Tetratricopeptide TPR_2 repeat protein [Anaeromyxobacter dehalogenans 2CP-1]